MLSKVWGNCGLSLEVIFIYPHVANSFEEKQKMHEDYEIK